MHGGGEGVRMAVEKVCAWRWRKCVHGGGEDVCMVVEKVCVWWW